MSAFFHNLMSRVRQQPPAVQVSDEGVTLLDGSRPRVSFCWAEVQEVVAFKRDLGICDDIRLALRIDDRWIEVSEEVEGWSRLVEALTQHIPTVPADWYASVMLPPFETCDRVLYKRT